MPSVSSRMNNSTEKEEVKCSKPPLKHGLLLDTIKIPKNIRGLKDRLPKANYDAGQRNKSVERKRTNLSMVEESSKDSSRVLSKVDVNAISGTKSKQSSGKQMPKELEKQSARISRVGLPPSRKGSNKENADPKK